MYEIKRKTSCVCGSLYESGWKIQHRILYSFIFEFEELLIYAESNNGDCVAAQLTGQQFL